MPTVKYKCMDSGKMKTKSFPYNAVGKAQATEFAKTMKGSIKNNPTKKNDGKWLLKEEPRKKATRYARQE